MWRWRKKTGEPCQACRAAPGRTVGAELSGEPPYLLCRACEDRLETQSLRPLEWFNLAARFGPDRPLLHDDLYSEEGVAEQPDAPVVHPEAYPAPTLDEARRDVERMIDYAVSRYFLSAGVEAALAEQDPGRVLASLDRRLRAGATVHVASRALEICAALGLAAGEWVRRRWEAEPLPPLNPLAKATAFCLPPDEGFPRVADALGRFPFDRRPILVLVWFRSAKTLDWIERHAVSPVLSGWGELAAYSGLPWERAAAWLDRGRPLSLVAIDALLACEERPNPFLRPLVPALVDPAPVEVMAEHLRAHAERDPVPRVENKVWAILRSWESRGTTEPPAALNGPG